MHVFRLDGLAGQSFCKTSYQLDLLSTPRIPNSDCAPSTKINPGSLSTHVPEMVPDIELYLQIPECRMEELSGQNEWLCICVYKKKKGRWEARAKFDLPALWRHHLKGETISGSEADKGGTERQLQEKVGDRRLVKVEREKSAWLASLHRQGWPEWRQ